MILQTEFARLKEDSLKIFNFLAQMEKFKKIGKVHRIGQNAELDTLKRIIDKGPEPDVVKKELVEIQYKMGVIRKKLKKLGPYGKMQLEAAKKIHQDDSSSESEEDKSVENVDAADTDEKESKSSSEGFKKLAKELSEASSVQKPIKFQKVVLTDSDESSRSDLSGSESDNQ